MCDRERNIVDCANRRHFRRKEARAGGFNAEVFLQALYFEDRRAADLRLSTRSAAARKLDLQFTGRDFVNAMATGFVALTQIDQRNRLLALFEPVRTARREAAALRRHAQVRRQSFDGLQFRAARLVQTRYRMHEAVRVGMCGLQENVVRGSLFDDVGRIHHVHAVGVARHDAKIVRDDDERDPEFARQILHQFENLRLNGHVECGGRFVGDDQLGFAGKADRDHDALAHAARKLVRVLGKPPLAVGDADLLHQFERPRLRILLRRLQMDEERLHDLHSDRKDRIERGHRLLEDHRDFVAAHGPHLFVGKFEQIAAFEQNAPTGHAAGLRKQTHDGQR